MDSHALFFEIIPATTYSPTWNMQYHRRWRVSLPSSGWDRVGPSSLLSPETLISDSVKLHEIIARLILISSETGFRQFRMNANAISVSASALITIPPMLGM